MSLTEELRQIVCRERDSIELLKHATSTLRSMEDLIKQLNVTLVAKQNFEQEIAEYRQIIAVLVERAGGDMFVSDVVIARPLKLESERDLGGGGIVLRAYAG